MAINTIRKWEKQLELETEEHLRKHTFITFIRSFKKIAPEKLRAFVKKYPDAYLREIAEAFKCDTKSIEAPKNNARYYEQDAEKVNEYLEKIKDIPKK